MNKTGLALSDLIPIIFALIPMAPFKLNIIIVEDPEIESGKDMDMNISIYVYE